MPPESKRQPKLERPPSTRPRIAHPFVVVFLLALGVYLATATYELGHNIDAIAAELPGHQLVTSGSLYLDEYAGTNKWLVETDSGHYASNRPPGLIAFSALAWLIASPFTTALSGNPTAAMAAVTSAIAVAVVGHVASKSTESTRLGVLAAVAFGLGTATWPFSSADLWPHGPTQMLLALSLLALQRKRIDLAAALVAASVLVRPPLGMVAAVLGTYLAISRRSFRPFLWFSGTGLISVGLLVWYNWAVFGAATLSGGYSGISATGNAGGVGQSYLGNFTSTFFDLSNGLMAWSPWLGVAIVVALTARRNQPDWITACAVAGLAYIAYHSMLNRFWAGQPYNYRYPLEAVTLAMPLAAIGIREAIGRPIARALLVVTLTISIGLQGMHAIVSDCIVVDTYAMCSLTGQPEA